MTYYKNCARTYVVAARSCNTRYSTVYTRTLPGIGTSPGWPRWFEVPWYGTVLVPVSSTLITQHSLAATCSMFECGVSGSMRCSSLFWISALNLV